MKKYEIKGVTATLDKKDKRFSGTDSKETTIDVKNISSTFMGIGELPTNTLMRYSDFHKTVERVHKDKAKELCDEAKTEKDINTRISMYVLAVGEYEKGGLKYQAAVTCINIAYLYFTNAKEINEIDIIQVNTEEEAKKYIIKAEDYLNQVENVEQKVAYNDYKNRLDTLKAALYKKESVQSPTLENK